jgi:uncharacterized protein (DUF736 family)
VISHRRARVAVPARKPRGPTEREYLSVKLDDPSFPATIWLYAKGNGDRSYRR